jgi:hypothetical protein
MVPASQVETTNVKNPLSPPAYPHPVSFSRRLSNLWTTDERNEFMSTIKTVTGAGLAAVALGATTIFGGTAIANAAPKDGAKASVTHQGHKAKRAPLVTGEEAQKVIDAALAAVPGTADHAHKTDAGNYLVKVRTAEDTTVIVTLNSSFEVTTTKEAAGKKDHIAITAEEKASAEAAALAEVPGATLVHVHKKSDGTYVVEIRTADGQKQIVKLDAAFTVTGVDYAKAGGKHRKGGHH